MTIEEKVERIGWDLRGKRAKEEENEETLEELTRHAFRQMRRNASIIIGVDR